MLDNVVGMLVIIFVINIVYVTLFTIRMIFTLKSQRYLAAITSVIEIVIYIVGLGLVLDNLDRPANLAAYAIGYGIGVIVGMKIEEKLALGYITVNVITKEYEPDIPNALRDKGYGVTNWVAYGREGERLMMEILTSRKSQTHLYNTVKALDPYAFIISHDTKMFYGGFWVKGIRR
ncbi:DUF2179 domain-containing protein [Bacillus sp. H-16]|uniref:DUF2179 domain-containing protein n=1 Tax=Alteribacter salitolerans TaxID=2912333 RepID=UPI001965CE37|nr:DUF5698 domain-containing protein [Alteribacter salitolerans]MBM7094903.1 DUF2179 domain-containing protein [Alteribacter salitolerans]